MLPSLRHIPASFYRISAAFMFLLVVLGTIRLFTFSGRQEDDRYKKDFREHYRVFSVNIPSDLNFAGEKVPVHDFEVRERIDRELQINTYWQSQTLLFVKRANRWFSVIDPILEKNGIPGDFKYLAVAESGFSHNVSPKGAAGFWQFIPATAESYGLTVNEEIDERYHVEKSTEAACRFFKEAYQRFGNWTLVAASYNLGMNGTARQLARQKVQSYYDLVLNEETSRYIFRVLAIKEIMQRPEEYGFILRKKDLYPPVPGKVVLVDSSISDLPLFAQKQHINYKLLKYFNPWLRSDKLKNPGKKVYRIMIPDSTVAFDYDELIRLAGSETKQVPPDSVK